MQTSGKNIIAQEFEVVKALTKDFAIFTDVSVSPVLKLGVGAYVMLPASFLEASSGVIGRPQITGRIKVRKFELSRNLGKAD